MCGRYFWNDEAEEAFEDDFPEFAAEVSRMRPGDYTPAMKALALTGANTEGVKAVPAGSLAGQAVSAGSQPAAEILQWGFHGFKKGRLLINARAESILTKPTFSESFRNRRCALPAAGFYEWDSRKEKVIFTLPDKPILYLAGIYRFYGPEKRFVILTREANESMAPVHDRMPLILCKEEVRLWVGDGSEAQNMLTKAMPHLKAERPYEQLTFEW